MCLSVQQCSQQSGAICLSIILSAWQICCELSEAIRPRVVEAGGTRAGMYDGGYLQPLYPDNLINWKHAHT